MASNPIDCITKHAKHLSTDVNISREAATDLALKEFEKLHGELENFKKSINPKYTKKAYISPDKSEAIKKITDDYQKQIDEANTPIPEPIKAEEKPQPEKTLVEDKQGAEKTKQQEIADKVRALKVNLSKLSGGGLQSNPLGLPVAVWNGAMDIVAKTIEVTGNVADAIQKGIKYIQKNHRGQWDKKGFNDQVLKELGVRGITVNGEDLIVKPQEREFAKTVNGWYSDLEQSVLDVKGEQGRGENWIKVLGKSDEAKWTGLNDWLSQQKGTVSKKDIQNFLKDNRIEVVEVVKGEVSNFTKDDIADVKINQHGAGNWVVKTKEDGTVEFPLDKADDKAEAIEYALEQLNYDNKSKRESKPKFQQYQLEGEKTNYKEVLVTMPSATKVEMPKPIETYTGSGKYKLVFDNGNQLSGTYTKEEVADVLKRRSEDKTGMYIDRNEQFKSSHFEEPNILVHLRMNTRVDAEGKKVLFLEEVQSDWGQKGKKEGFDSEKNDYKEIADRFAKGLGFTQGSEADVKLALKRIKQKSNIWEREYAAFKEAGFSDAEINKMAADYTDGQTPSAPFVTETPSWTKLGLKVALKEAVKEGADKIAWTTGEQQNDRYDLSKQVDWINAEKTQKGDYKIEVGHKDNRPMETQYLKENELEPNLGKELATKIINDGGGMYKGLDLKVGGKGMKGFYGSPTEGSLGIVGNVAKSLFKQEPKTVELQNTSTGIASQDKVLRLRDWVQKNKNEDYSYNDAQKDINDNSKLYQEYQKNTPTQHSIDITPELKAEVEGGLPLFKDIKGRGKEIADLLRKGKIKQSGLQSNIAGIPIAVYNGAIEVIARALEKGATLTQAINEAYKKLKLKERKGFKQDEFIQKLEEATGEKFIDEESGKEPPKPPKEPTVTGGEGEGKKGGITHEGTEETTRKIGLPDYEGVETVTNATRIAEAKAAIAANPNLADEILTKVEKREGNLTPQDNAVLAVYKSTLDSELEKNPSKEVYDRISRIAKVLNPEGSYEGQLLQSRKLIDFNEDNLANFLMGKEAAQGTALSEKQVKDESAKFTELKKAKDALAELEAADKEAYNKLVAEIGVNKAKAAARKASKKTKEEHIADRKAIVEKAREALKKIRGNSSLKSTIPGLAELKALAPHVKNYMQDLLNEGVDKFDNIVSAIHAEFKDVLDNLRKADVIDILAGNHDEVKEQTRNEKANSLRLIKREADLIKELADARKGIDKEKSETKKTTTNRRIDELTKKIKEVKRLRKNEVEQEPVEDVTVGSAEALNKEVDMLTKKADKLLDDIKNKKYLEEKAKPTVFKKSRKAQLLEDRVIDLENKIRHERSVDEYSKRSKARRIFDKVMEFLGVRRLVQSALDMSVPLRQGATLLSPRRIDVWAKGFKANLQSVFNPKKFERIMRGIRQDPMYHDMVKDGVVFNDLSSADPNLHNEDFRKSFVYKIPILSEPLKASNRSADAFLNIARFELYKKFRANLEKQGLTRESDPKAFSYAGNWAMSMTGRGNMHSSLEKPAMNAILGNTFYGARLMASRFNLLNPVTYFDPRVPRQAKVEAMKDMASFTVTVMTIAIGLAAAGGAVSLDPDDPDFLKIRFGDKVYDITGGLSTYVRTFLRIAKAGYTKATGTKEEGDKATAKAGQSTLQFFRNKLSPNTSYGVDAFFGKPYGKDFDPTEIYQIYPMYTDDVLKSLKDEGILAIPTVLLPNILGLGYANYPSRDDKSQSQGNTFKIKNTKPKIERPKPQKISRE